MNMCSGCEFATLRGSQALCLLCVGGRSPPDERVADISDRLGLARIGFALGAGPDRGLAVPATTHRISFQGPTYDYEFRGPFW